MKSLKYHFNFLILSAVFTYSKSEYTKGNVKFFTLLNLSSCLSFNVLLLWMIIHYNFYPGFSNFLVINFFPEKKFDPLISLFIYIYLPIWFITYLLLFRKDRYKKLQEEYPKAQNNKYFTNYYLFSGLCLIIYAFIIICNK
jgi:hypothetical protein